MGLFDIDVNALTKQADEINDKKLKQEAAELEDLIDFIVNCPDVESLVSYAISEGMLNTYQAYQHTLIQIVSDYIDLRKTLEGKAYEQAEG